MAVVNNNKPLLDMPQWEILQPQPAASAVGVCTCSDRRGTDRYVYLLISATSFWRYDLWSNTYQQLASPPGGTVGAGTVMCYDPSRTRVWALITSGTGSPWWGYYDPATNAWTARSITNLPATFGTDGGLTHTCSTYNAAGNDDYFYLVGNNATTLYRYSVTGDAWIATLTAVTAAPGAGCALHWLPGWNTDRIVCIRGGATATIYYYSITGNNWTAITFQPATETFTTGSLATPNGLLSKIFVQKDATLRIYLFDPAAGTLVPVATEYLIATGAAHVGDRFFYAKSADGIEFLYMGLHTSSYLLRTGLFF